MESIRYSGMGTTFRRWCLLLVLAGGWVMACRAQQATQAVTVAADETWSPEVRLVLPDVRMCPGETYDLPVYIEIDEASAAGRPIQILSFNLGFHFPEYMIVESAAGVVTDLHAGLSHHGSFSATYQEAPEKSTGLPDHVFTCGWGRNDQTYFFTPKSGEILFRLRIRYKEEREGLIDLVSHDYTGHGGDDKRDYSHFIVMGASPKGLVLPAFDTAYVRPSTPPQVSALSDTTVCVNSRTQLWAEGGVQYEWKDISPVSGTYRPAIAEPRVQYPIFQPLDPGYYMYQVKITDKTGCTAKDTVYCYVLDNGLNLDLSADTMVPLAETAPLDATVYGGYPPYRLSWQPADLVQTPVKADVQPDRAGGRVTVENRSLPLQRPQWFTVKVEDRYCAFEKRQSVNVLGSDIEAFVTAEPSYFCRQSTVNESVRLSVEARGGSGRYDYEWTVENLEAGTKEPVFETTDGPTARLRFFSRCVVHVLVSDFQMRKLVRITDTIRLIDQTVAEVTVEDLNGAVCEMNEMTFTARTENGGENPRFSWRIDGREVASGPDSVYKTYMLRPGEQLSCVLKSDKACVKQAEVTSAPVIPEVLTPGYMTVRPGFGDDAVNVACGDRLSLMVLHRFTGRKFRLRWFRNDVAAVYDEVHTFDQAVEGEAHTTTVSFPRGGYYDYYRAAVTESSRPCLLLDSVTTECVYPRLAPDRVAEIGPVYVHPDDTANLCEGHDLMVYARDVAYLPQTFRLVWYVRKAGAPVAEAKGYYATDDFGSAADNAAYGRNLGASSEFNAADAYYRTQNWLLKGFPLSLSTAAGGDVADGDSVYYRLETKVGCAAAVDKTSPRFIVRTRPLMTNGYTSEFFSTIEDIPNYCEGITTRFIPTEPSSALLSYTWFIDGEQINGLHPELLAGDTLTVTLHNGQEIALVSYNAHRCLAPNVSRTVRRTREISHMYSGFRRFAMADTLVCSEAPVTLWAAGEPYRRGTTLPSHPETNRVPDWLPDYEGTVKVEWAMSRSDAVAGHFVHTGLTFATSVDSARFGDRSADLHKDSATVGTQTFVVRLTNDIGCMAYDSVRVTVGYRRQPKVVVVPEPAFPWCESLKNAYFKLEGEFLGEKPTFMLHVGKWYDVRRPDSIPYRTELFKPDLPVRAYVYGSMLTCDGVSEAIGDSLWLQTRGLTQIWLRQEGQVPQTALKPVVCLGDELRVESFGSTKEDLQKFSGMQLSVEEIIDRLWAGYTYEWTDEETGVSVSNDRILKVRPDGPRRYRLQVQDTGRQCPAVTVTVQVDIAVKTGVSLKFADKKLGVEVPFSLCEGSRAAQLTWRAFPQNFSGNAYMGFSIMTAESGYQQARQSWVTHKADTVITAWFFPGDRLIYGYFHDTVSCSGAAYLMDSMDLQSGRPASLSFRAQPDTLLCRDAQVRLNAAGAKRQPTQIPDGSPSLKDYLVAHGIAGAADLPDDGLATDARPSADMAMVYWWPQTGMVTATDKTSPTPLVSPDGKQVYQMWGYNEYGCIQTDSVRVERFVDGGDWYFELVLRAEDTVLCDKDSLWLSLDRQTGSILTLFDSLVWKRVPRANGSAPGRGPEVLGVNADRLYVGVSDGDTVYVEGYVRGDGLCEQIAPQWVTSNKVTGKTYRRPSLSLVQVETAACADSTLELRATADAAFVQWLRVDSPDKGYEVLERGPTDQKTAWARVRTFKTFTARAMAYDHPACEAYDSITVTVSQTLDTLHMVLAEPQVVCDGDPVTVSVADRRHVESWQWRLNGRYMTYEDFDSEALMSDFLVGRLSSFSGRFKAGDRLWAEGRTTARCVYNPVVMSDTITITRGNSPVLTWLAPAELADGSLEEGGHLLRACADESLPVRFQFSPTDAVSAVWQTGSERVDLPLDPTDMGGAGRAYALTLTYPDGAGVLRIEAMKDGCMTYDSLWLVGRAYDTVAVAIEASAATVCQGEEVAFRLSRWAGADSAAWYVNDRAVWTGPVGSAASPAASYRCRPAAGDRVYVAAYSHSPCVVNNGLLSNTLSVEVLSGGEAAGTVEAALTASADSVCGPGAPVYTVRGRGFDSVYWYANGRLSAVSDLTGASSDPAVRAASWRRVPRPSAEGADSVYVLAVRRERVCLSRDSALSPVVSVYRREMPVVSVSPRDTTVTVGEDMTFSASGASAYVWWTDLDHEVSGEADVWTLTMVADTVQVYVMGYEPAFGPDSLAGGETSAPAPGAYGEFSCRHFDSVCVRPGALPAGRSVYIPNTVLLNAARPADRVFKVFGEGIAQIHMRIFRDGGNLVFEKTGENPVWKPEDIETGNYTYKVTITWQDGETTQKSGWISVLE